MYECWRHSQGAEIVRSSVTTYKILITTKRPTQIWSEQLHLFDCVGAEKVIYEAHKKYHIARCHDDKWQLLVGSVHLLPGDIMNGAEVVSFGFLFFSVCWVARCPVDTSSRRRGTRKRGNCLTKTWDIIIEKVYSISILFTILHRRSLSSSWTVSHYYFILVRIHTCRCARQSSCFALVRFKVKSVGDNSTLTDDEFLG